MTTQRKYSSVGILVILGALVANLLYSSIEQENVAQVSLATISEATHATTTASADISLDIDEVATDAIEEKGDGTPLYRVADVVDGDTIKVMIDGKKETIRLIGLNTPETVDPRKPVECFGKEAAIKAKQMLGGQSIQLEFDDSQGERDKYGRILAYVFRSDGVFYNLEMIESGHAYEYTYARPYKYQAEFKLAQKTAQGNSLGLWSDDTCKGIK